MNSQKRTSYFLILSLLVAGCFLISPAAQAADTPSGSSEEVSQLLSQIKSEAIALKDDADVLATYARTKQISAGGHAEKLNEIRDHVNQAGKLLAELQEVKSTASPWQQKAIDRIYPLLQELADNTHATLDHFNDNRARIHFATYEDYAKAGYTLAEELTTLISDYVDYGNHEAEYQRLQEKLDKSS